MISGTALVALSLVQGPSGVSHHVNPTWTKTSLTYQCPDGERSITVEQDNSGHSKFVSVVRKGQSVGYDELDRASSHLSDLSFWKITPQCGKKSDLLLLTGSRGLAKMRAFIVWTDDGIRVLAPEPVN